MWATLSHMAPVSQSLGHECIEPLLYVCTTIYPIRFVDYFMISSILNLTILCKYNYIPLAQLTHRTLSWGEGWHTIETRVQVIGEVQWVG